MGYGASSRSPGRGARRSVPPPAPKAGLDCSLDGCQDGQGPNPFAQENAKWLRNRRRALSAPRRSPVRSSRRTASANRERGRQQGGEQVVLRALERLEERDTLELGVRQLQDVLVSLEPQRLSWFLRTVFDEKKPLNGVKARREQLLILTDVVRRFPGVVLSSGALQERILPCLLSALKANDMLDTVSYICTEIFETLCPDGDVSKFLTVWPIVIKAFLDALVLGAGWDLVKKQRSLQVLGTIVPFLLGKASAIGSDSRVMAVLTSFGNLLSQCLVANPTLHEGLLQCMMHLAAQHGSSMVHQAVRLAEICATHLTETPSLAPTYAQPTPSVEDGRAESPPRRSILTRELALACCVCLKHIAEDIAPEMPRGQQQDLVKLRPSVEAALARKNLNLQRLIRGNEPLRVAIAHAWQAWHEVEVDKPARKHSPDSTLRPAGGARVAAKGLRAAAKARHLAPPHRRGLPVHQEPETQPHETEEEEEEEGDEGEDLPQQRGRQQHREEEQQEQQQQQQQQQQQLQAPLPVIDQKQRAQQDSLPPVSGADCMQPLDTPLHMMCECMPPGQGPQDWSAGRCKAQPLNGAGPLPSSVALQPGPLPAREVLEALPPIVSHRGLDPVAPWADAPDSAALGLDAALLSIAAGSIDEAFRCIFSIGNEKSLEAVIDQLDAASTWELLPPDDARHLAHLLARWVCKDPLAAPALKACDWLSALMQRPTGRQTLSVQDIEGLRTALFSLSANTGVAGTKAVSLFNRLFQGQPHQHQHQQQQQPADHSMQQPLPPSGGGSGPMPPPLVAAAKAPQQSGGAGPLPCKHALPASRPPIPPVSPAPPPMAAEELQESRPLPQRPVQPVVEVVLPPATMPRSIPEPRITWTAPPDGDAPGLGTASRCIATGAVNQAFECVFSVGNEKTLVAVLDQVEPGRAWTMLPSKDARHLAHLLARLLCKDPFAGPALKACDWLTALLQWPGGKQALEMEDLEGLQSALFALSVDTGAVGTKAASLFYQLFQESS